MAGRKRHSVIAVDVAVGALDPFGARAEDLDELEPTLDALGAMIAAVHSVSPGELGHGPGVVRNRLPGHARARRRRRGWSLAPRGTLIAVFAAGLLAVGGAAYAAVHVFVNADTGRQLHGWERKTGGPGTVIDLSGTNIRQVLDRDRAGTLLEGGGSGRPRRF